MRILCIGLDFLMLGSYQWKAVELARHASAFLAIVPAKWRFLWSDGDVAPESGPLDSLACHRVRVAMRGNKHFALFPPIFLRRTLREFRPDVIDFDNEPFNASAAQVISAARRHAPSARVFLHASQNLLKRYPPPFNTLERYAFRHCGGVFARNEEAAVVLRQRGLAEHKIHVMGHGVSLQEFESCRERQLSGAVRGGSVLYVGYLARQKGVDTLIDACARSGSFQALTIAGDGPQLEALQSLARERAIEGRVDFRGHVSHAELKDLYASHACLALPSRTTPTLVEQFGRVLIEAMAAGCPIVASTSGNIPRVVGDAGLLFPEDEADVLAQRLDEVLGDAATRHELQRRGIRRVQQVFEWSVRAQRMLQIFRSTDVLEQRQVTDPEARV
jgi:glycosyltransferase involved in cell wall biosynthesis